MSKTSVIEWTDASWNPVTGCTKLSRGCKHCYAERMSKRLRAMGVKKYARGFSLSLHPDQLEQPLQWSNSRRIFVNSMSDLFHEQVPLKFISECFQTMAQAHWHVFQVLTKRSARLAQLAPQLPWPNNIWMGVSIEDSTVLSRINDLRGVPAKVRFLSCEPLLGPLTDLDLRGLHWVIVGGESGPGARPVDKEWVLEIRQKCFKQGVPFFFKQWGGVNKKKTGRLLEGQIWNEMPQRSIFAVKGCEE